MKLHIALIALLVVAFSITLFAFDEDIPLERQGNEAAATADSLYHEDDFIGAAAKYEDAYNLFQRAEQEDGIDLDDKITALLANMVTSYYQAEDYVNAVRIIKKRLARDPSNDVFARQIAQIYNRILNQPEQAIQVLKEFEENNNNFAVRRSIARIKTSIEDDTGALEWYQKAFEVRQDPEVLQNIAVLQHRLGNTEDAIKSYESFLETDISEAVRTRVYRNIGRFYQDLGEVRESISYYERANRLRYSREITTHLMVTYYELGDFLNAREYANTLLRENTNNADAIYYTARILFEQDRYSEAREYFNRITDHREYGQAARQFVESIDSMM